MRELNGLKKGELMKRHLRSVELAVVSCTEIILCMLLLIIMCVMLVSLLYLWLVQWMFKVLTWADNVTSVLVRERSFKNLSCYCYSLSC